MQLICWMDIDGYYGILFTELNHFLSPGIRFCFQLALFRACETYGRPGRKSKRTAAATRIFLGDESRLRR